jgi:hypothetical protein
MDQIRLFFDENRFHKHQTPDELKMEDDDVIDEFIIQKTVTVGNMTGPTCQGHPDIFTVRWTIPGVVCNRISKFNIPSFIIGNTMWSVILKLNEETGNAVVVLVFFLDVSQDPNVMDTDEGGVDTCFELTVENKDPQMTEARVIHHRFCRESAGWGFFEMVRKMDEEVDL